MRTTLKTIGAALVGIASVVSGVVLGIAGKIAMYRYALDVPMGPSFTVALVALGVFLVTIPVVALVAVGALE